MSRRTISVYLNKEVNQELDDHLNKLAANGESLSNFFIDAANEYIRENDSLDLNKQQLIKLIKEIVQEEVQKYTLVENKDTSSITDEKIAAKLKGVY